MAAIKKRKKKSYFVFTYAKENTEPTQQWGLTNAESSGSSIMQLP